MSATPANAPKTPVNAMPKAPANASPAAGATGDKSPAVR